MSDDGYFPRGTSLLRHVHSQRAVGLLYGQRALAIGALHPLNFIGTRDHTRAPTKPFQRLARTGKMFETVFFGTKTEADRVLAIVRGMHEEVVGEIPQDAGRFAAGTPYAALDPELMLWTIAVAFDSAERMYELFIRRLEDDEHEQLWREYVRFGELFGMAPEVAPRSYGDFREYYDGFIDSDEAHLTDDARETGLAVLFHIPVPLTHQPAMQVHNLIMLGALPPRVRGFYGLRWTAAHAVAYEAVVRAVRTSRPFTPAPLRRGRNTAFFDGVAAAERALLARGRTVRGTLAQSG